MNEIIPGILEREWLEIGRKLSLIKSFTDKAHIDLIDGKFADNLTFLDPTTFKHFSSDLFLEAHMMVDEPINYLKPFAEAGFKRFIGHIEKMSNPVEFVEKGKLLGEVGLAIDSPTSLDVLGDLNLGNLDFITILMVKAGSSGQEFDPQLLEKVRQIRQKYPYLTIEVDGGINDKTLPQSKEAGATRFVSTSYISNSDNPQEKFETLRNL